MRGADSRKQVQQTMKLFTLSCSLTTWSVPNPPNAFGLEFTLRWWWYSSLSAAQWFVPYLSLLEFIFSAFIVFYFILNFTQIFFLSSNKKLPLIHSPFCSSVWPIWQFPIIIDTVNHISGAFFAVQVSISSVKGIPAPPVSCKSIAVSTGLFEMWA